VIGGYCIELYLLLNLNLLTLFFRYDGVRPNMGHLPRKGHWYEGLEYGSNNTQLNPFFYGVTLELKPVQYTYQSDAISANTQLTKAYFNHFHKYRLEWEPPNDDGKDGYIKWYLDGKFLYGIRGDNLNLTNTEIPSEPMYLLMNTAIASSWGFPKPCPDGCTCECYECGNPECVCGLPDGFCDNFPATFEIEYVRTHRIINLGVPQRADLPQSLFWVMQVIMSTRKRDRRSHCVLSDEVVDIATQTSSVATQLRDHALNADFVYAKTGLLVPIA
jgi:hypothetical protein